jgi:hypothetical protein
VEEQCDEKIELIEESVKKQMLSERDLFQERICELETDLQDKQEANRENQVQYKVHSFLALGV